MKTAIVIGATGLTGSHLVELLKKDDTFGTIRILSRRPVAITDSKIKVVVVDFNDPAAFKTAIGKGDAVFCCIGTTQKKVKGDLTSYRKVDYDIPLTAARFCAEAGCPHFLLISSVGANSQARNFYLRLKGEVEDAIRQTGIPAISILRPSLLMGRRKEFRTAERLGQMLAGFFAFLIPSKYKPVAAATVAKAMLAAAKNAGMGHRIYHFNEIRELAGQ